MKSWPSKYSSNDCVETPLELARALVEHFHPNGVVLEPCSGEGNFLKFLPGALWCEIKRGRNFFDFDKHVNYIFTNPPFSEFGKFLEHSLKVSDNICFLMSVSRLWTKSRIRLIEKNNFGIREILLFNGPRDFDVFGFQLGMIWLKRDYVGEIRLSHLKEYD